MLHQDEETVEVLAVDTPRKPAAETGKNQLNKTSKPMFLQKNFQKCETLIKKDVSFSKPKSRILKKKPSKDKFKLFKLDKCLLGQIPQFGKPAKCLKKKDKLVATAQMNGSQVLGKEKTSYGRANRIRSCRSPKPMEYTFDIFCLTDNISLPPLVKEPDHVGKPLFTDLLSMSSSSEEVMLASKAGANNVLVADLIDLGTPKTFKSHAGHSGRSVSVYKAGELEEGLQFNWNPLLSNSVEPCSLDALAPIQTRVISDVENLVRGLLENLSSRNTSLKDDHNDSSSRNSGFELDGQCQSQKNYGGDLDERATSPLVFYGFPRLDSPKGEKQQILTAQSRQTLIDRLNKNPFPKVAREKGKLRVRRRAFSMDDTLIAYLPCGPGEVVHPESVDKEETILNEEAPCTQNSELNSSSQKSSEPIENMKHSSLMEEVSGGVNRSDRETRCSDSNEIISSSLSQYSKDTTLESSTDFAIDKWDSFACSSTMPRAAENLSIPERESGPILPSEPPNVNINIEESAGSAVERIIESSSVAEECRCVPDFIEGPSVASYCPPQTENLLSSVASDSTHTERVCEGAEETQPKSSIEESAGGVSFLQQEVSPGLVITMEPCSQNVELDMTNFATSEKGLLVNRNVDECGHRVISSQIMVEHTPTPPSSEEKELPECPQVSHQTNPSKLVVDDNFDDMSGQLTSNVISTLTTSPAFSQETAIMLDIFPRVDPNTEIKEEVEDKASNKPTEETVSPTTAAFDDSDSDSIFCDDNCMTPLEHWVLPAGKKYRRSLSIIRNLDEHPSANARRGRHYEKSVEEIIRLQGNNAEAWTPVKSLRQRLSMRRSSWMRQITPPPVRRSTFIWSPTIPSCRTLFESPLPRKSIYSTPMHHNLVYHTSVGASPMHGPRRPTRSSISRDCAPASPVQYTIKDLILAICKQTESCSFSDILSQESYSGGCKLGEGVFGEVFSISRDGQRTVLKIIPIEGQQLVNGEKQKTYQEVLSELVIAKVLDELRYEGSDETNQTSGYAQLIATSLVQGSYPEPLLRFWEEFDQTKGSDNENPGILDEEQLFIVMEQGNGGKDVESYTFSSAKQSLSVLKQIAFSLAVAEISVEFEHRDLHWGNVLVSKTSEKQILYTLNGTQYSVASNGVKCTIIDYTLSRIKYINQVPIYNDIGKDPEMFIATGDYQFDIYRLMKKDVEDDWSRFAPKTNARWLHYLLDKMLTKVKYQRKTAKVHKDSFKALEEISTWIEDCGSALSVAMRLAESKH